MKHVMESNGLWSESQVEAEGKRIASAAPSICMDVHTHKPVVGQHERAAFIKTFFGPVFYFRVLAPVKSDVSGEVYAAVPVPKVWKVMGVLHQGATMQEIVSFRQVLRDAALRIGAHTHKDTIMESTQSVEEATNMMRATRSLYRPLEIKMEGDQTAETLALIVEWSDPTIRDITSTPKPG